jgi:hypothetical protein
MLKLFALLVSLLIFAAPAAPASPAKARIPCGIGILLIDKAPKEKLLPLVIYKEPSLGRIAEIDTGRLPPLSQSVSCPQEFTPVIVTSKKSGWYRIIYDDGEREGWIEGRSGYQLFRWDELLRNRLIELIGGLKKEFYQLRRAPDSSSELVENLGKGNRVTTMAMQGEWVSVITPKAQGWLRWRDDNDRLVIAINL